MDKKGFWDISELARKWQLLKKLIKDKKYKVPPAKKFFYVASLIYVVSPFDFIPEYFTPLGFIDDVGALTLFFIHVVDEVEKYEQHLRSGGADKKGGESAKEKPEHKGKTIDLDKEGSKTE